MIHLSGLNILDIEYVPSGSILFPLSTLAFVSVMLAIF